jgi:ssRNA-specific RNase YbeY (16S rRNA maturation enzyme)
MTQPREPAHTATVAPTNANRRQPTPTAPTAAGMASLSLTLCGDEHIRALNFRHRGKDYATDVLSFEMEDELDFKAGFLNQGQG